MLSALRELKTAHAEGLLSDEEFDKERCAIMAGGAARWAPDPGTSMATSEAVAELRASIDTFAAAFSPVKRAAEADAKKRKSCAPKYPAPSKFQITPSGAIAAVPTAREEGQKSVFELKRPVTVQQHRNDGRVFVLGESAIKKPERNVLACRFVGCSKTFDRACDRARHEKIHKGPVKKPRSVLEMNHLKQHFSAKQAEVQKLVEIKWVVNDILADVFKQVGKPGGWLQKVDGRKKNSGSSTRIPRSPHFKKRVICDYERYLKMYPDTQAEMSSMVADMYNITPNQVRTWYRGKSDILAAALNRENGKTMRKRAKRGKFHAAEEAVFKKFKSERKRSRRIGPRWIRRTMLQEVRAMADPPTGAGLFKAKRGWLRRFCARFRIALRRKSNVKKTPVKERVPLLKRFFAVFRKMLAASHNTRGYCTRMGLYKIRFSLDQVPAGAFDPKSTYEEKGADRVVIAANEAFDKYRWCTLQILLRNRKDPSLPRHGQPKLTICFRGTGSRIAPEERAQYHADVVVLFQPKAWFDAATCNKWVMELAGQELRKSELEQGQRFLILADNLSGQTKQTNPEFCKLLSKMCSADVWNLLANNTDEIQVVDAGFGKLVKGEADEILNDWLEDEAHFEEWMGGRMTASRKRVLMTHWYAAGYEKACERFDFVSVFDRTGSNLTADGSSDSLIKLQGLDSFSFDMGDLARDPSTGQLPGEAPLQQQQQAPNTPIGVSDGDGEEEQEEVSARSDEQPSEEEDEEEPVLEGDDFNPALFDDVDVWDELPDGYPGCVLDKQIYHRYEDAWYPGLVKRQIRLSAQARRNGKFAVKFDDTPDEMDLNLLPDDYGADAHWVLVK